MDPGDYKEIARELNNLRHDLARSAAAGKFTASANKGAIEELKAQVIKLERRLRTLESVTPTVELRLLRLEEKDKEHTGKIQTFEVTKAESMGVLEVIKTKEEEETKRAHKRWALYATVITSLITSVFNLLMHLWGK